ncbi:MAG: class I tRNA ligase family protein [archaeon]
MTKRGILRGASKLWNELVKAGDIYKKQYKGLYCSGCESFKTEKELDDGKCPNHPTREIEEVQEENYFFALSKYRERVAEKIKNDEYQVVPKIRKNEIISWLKTAKDISFSRPRSTLPWGIPVPEDPEQVMYVWCDALSNYITGAGYGTDKKIFRDRWPADIHIIGKDILRFHAAFWPAMLMSAKVALPKKLFVHGFILLKGAKMSKSTGNVVEPFEEILHYGVDPFRFYIVGAMQIDGDGEYSEDLVEERINTELVGNLSNFCYRVLSFANKNFDSRVVSCKDNVSGELKAKYDAVREAYEGFDFKRTIDEIMAASAIGNRYFQDNEPWKLVREDRDKAHKVVSLCVNMVRNLSIMMQPVMPEFALQLQSQLNAKGLFWKDIGFRFTGRINEAQIILRKVEKLERFPLSIKVAVIESVEDHPDADKLLVLGINLGSEKRQLVAGLRGHYSRDELIGKKICVITNLKYAKLRGVESQGMLLAGDDGKKIGLLTVDAKPGAQIGIEGMKANDAQIDFKDFMKIELKAVKGRATYGSRILKAGSEEIAVERVKDGKIR